MQSVISPRFVASLAIVFTLTAAPVVRPRTHSSHTTTSSSLTSLMFADVRGQLMGVIRDVKTNPVANIEVMATNQVTGEKTRTTTDGQGRYTLRLDPGAYRINVELFNASNPEAERLQVFEQEQVIVGKTGGDMPLDITLRRRALPANSPLINSELPRGQGFEPLGAAGDESVESRPQTEPDRREVRDRFRIGFPEYDRYGDRGRRGRDIPFRKGRFIDPYNQSVIKGDFPFIGNNYFMILGGSSAATVELRRTPTPSGASADEPGSAEFFGQPEALAVIHTVQLNFEFFKGDTVFRPRSFAFKFSPTFSIPNFVNARERGVLNIDPRRGTNRTDLHASFEEAFGEVKLMDVNENYDFVSVRAGIQPFVSDFRGFIFSDNNLAARLFGGFDNNRYQFNAAAFTMLEKDTNSGLNSFKGRRQNVYIANLFRQDTFRKGYAIQGSLLYNDDRGGVEFDKNGFLVRPNPLGDFQLNRVQVGYVGFNGDGHLGILNLTNSYYFAFGNETHNPIAGRGVKVRSHMAAVEASIDRDYLRFRASAFFTSGDKDPTDDRATGFDAIFDDPNFIGGQFSYWNRNGIRLTQTGVGLVQPNSLIPSLRSSKSQGQSNAVNPGITILNLGLDAEITQKIKAIANVSYLRFNQTEALKLVLFQPQVRKDIGFDYSIGVAYRPFLNNNVTFNFGAATLTNGRGLRDIFTDQSRNCPVEVTDYCAPQVINPRKPMYTLFVNTRFLF
ncbi:MAG: carboxypeptidase-like regulatory domain-containing protein [Pyrinomonadaceae bacterium MAG19_C2-C3]|nr:carboxypeptidase-like regulatory domain-containing protein [Pyrinomonadaceae bacterium MAG19_C2-C3]